MIQNRIILLLVSRASLLATLLRYDSFFYSLLFISFRFVWFAFCLPYTGTQVDALAHRRSQVRVCARMWYVCKHMYVLVCSRWRTVYGTTNSIYCHMETTTKQTARYKIYCVYTRKNVFSFHTYRSLPFRRFRLSCSGKVMRNGDSRCARLRRRATD